MASDMIAIMIDVYLSAWSQGPQDQRATLWILAHDHGLNTHTAIVPAARFAARLRSYQRRVVRDGPLLAKADLKKARISWCCLHVLHGVVCMLLLLLGFAAADLTHLACGQAACSRACLQLASITGLVCSWGARSQLGRHPVACDCNACILRSIGTDWLRT